MIADYIILTRKTIRQTANVFKISKSTVHKDIQVRLHDIDEIKYNTIKKIMNEHLKIRHIRGGEATRQLFLRKRQVTL